MHPFRFHFLDFDAKFLDSTMNYIQDMDRDSFYPIIYETIDLVHDHTLDCSIRYKLMTLLSKLKMLKQCHGQNHPSMPGILNTVGDILGNNDLSQQAILFFLEQIRIERYYLGSQHHDLAFTLHKVGQIFFENHQLMEAENCFSEAITILDKSNKKGHLYAIIVFNMALIKYNNSLYIDAFTLFNVAANEQRSELGNFHPDVADMCLQVGNFQLEIGELTDAMENYLEALMIIRQIHGNTHSKTCEALHKIGCIHQERGEYTEAIDALNQVSSILRQNQDKNISSIIAILYQMALLYQCLEDISNAIIIFQEIIKIISSKLGQRHACLSYVLSQLSNIYIEFGMMESSKEVIGEIQDILNSSQQTCDDSDNDLVATVVELFGFAVDCSPHAAAAA